MQITRKDGTQVGVHIGIFHSQINGRMFKKESSENWYWKLKQELSWV